MSFDAWHAARRPESTTPSPSSSRGGRFRSSPHLRHRPHSRFILPEQQPCPASLRSRTSDVTIPVRAVAAGSLSDAAEGVGNRSERNPLAAARLLTTHGTPFWRVERRMTGWRGNCRRRRLPEDLEPFFVRSGHTHSVTASSPSTDRFHTRCFVQNLASIGEHTLLRRTTPPPIAGPPVKISPISF